MRRIGITFLAALYATLILSSTVARTTAWANQESEALLQSCGAESSSRITHADKSDPVPSQKKWIESGFAVELPQEATLGPILSSYHTFLSIAEYHPAHFGPGSSSRAPPSLS